VGNGVYARSQLYQQSRRRLRGGNFVCDLPDAHHGARGTVLAATTTGTETVTSTCTGNERTLISYSPTELAGGSGFVYLARDASSMRPPRPSTGYPQPHSPERAVQSRREGTGAQLGRTSSTNALCCSTRRCASWPSTATEVGEARSYKFDTAGQSLNDAPS